jgi:hypothetical protein
MGALLGFLPFIVFALAEKAMGIVPALAAGALVSSALLVRARMHGTPEINILEAGSALVFAALTLLAWVWGDASGAWSVWLVRLWVDGGLLISVLLGLALRRPFTLQYARQQVSPEIALKRRFLRTNNILSAAWACAFVVLAGTDLLMVLRPSVSSWIGVVLTVGALAAAACFTRWYPTTLHRA